MTEAQTDTRRWDAEVAIARFMEAKLTEMFPLNGVLLSRKGEKWGNGATHFTAMIHVPAGPSGEMRAAVVAIVNNALGDVRHVFTKPSVAPEVVIEREDDTLFVRHNVRLELRTSGGADTEEAAAMTGLKSIGNNPTRVPGRVAP